MNLFLITGTTKGLGAALRDLLAADAGNLVITLSRAPAKMDSPSNVYVDFADIASIEPAFANVRRQIPEGRFARAVLLNNAGVANPVARFDRLDSAGLANNLNVNLIAPMMTTQLFAQLTRERAAHRLVVNISSGAARRAIAGWSAYCAAKAGLEMATRVAALEAATDDPTLAICSLAPGVVDTPMQAQIRAADFPEVERFRAMKADGVLRPARDVARDMLKLIHDNRLANGGNYDIRELLNA